MSDMSRRCPVGVLIVSLFITVGDHSPTSAHRSPTEITAAISLLEGRPSIAVCGR